MKAVGKLINSVSEALEFNQATLSGCVDIIVVQQQDGSLKSTPFHARFGKLKVLKSKDKSVRIHVNNRETSIVMKLGEAGEAFFEEEIVKSSQLKEDLMILPEAESPQMETVKQSCQGCRRHKGIKEILQMKHTPSNQSTSAQTKAAEDMSSDCAYDCGINITDSVQNEMHPEESKNLGKKLLSGKHHHHHHHHHKKDHVKKLKIKTLRPSSDILKSFELRIGANTISYTVQSLLQGSQTITGVIYYWPSHANIIISDVDGTITKTDLLGHIMPMFGKDWSQPGIAPLYTNIRRNGYYILYLTSRPIGQAAVTKEFLQSVYQDGSMLPHGPLIMSPDRLLPSFKREIVFKRPELFKMAALKDIRSLFPADHNPFHAGFGNRDTDAIAYKSVGIPLEKVFIVNPAGDIHHHTNTTAKSYTLINNMIKELFPCKDEKRKLSEALDPANLLTLDNPRSIDAGVAKVVS